MNTQSFQSECLLIADDLTGTCDAAVPFAARGLRSTAWLDPRTARFHPGVNAISTDSRNAPVQTFRDALKALPELEPKLIFKKIDSTLRGRPGEEILIAFESFRCDLAIVTPAFPAMSRTVLNGWLRIEGVEEFAPLHVATHLSLPDRRFACMDAVCDADLDEIVNAGLKHPGRVLWAGSAGLAWALARALGGPAIPHQRPGLRRGVAFAIGSDHAVTLEQQRKLVASRLTTVTSDAECARAALLRGEHVLVRVPRGDHIPPVIQSVRGDASALVLSGGDTAAAVCRALQAESIELAGEIAPGIPYGFLDGTWQVATKSGAFGAPDALIQIADFFQCP